MYAVIRAGGKQHKVAQGDVIEIERLNGSEDVEFTPLLVVDDDGNVKATSSELAGARVSARVVGETKGDKIRIFRYKNKSRNRRRIGHRQTYSTIEISKIELQTRRKTTKKEEAKDGS